jgi:hypothetical protein
LDHVLVGDGERERGAGRGKERGLEEEAPEYGRQQEKKHKLR